MLGLSPVAIFPAPLRSGAQIAECSAASELCPSNKSLSLAREGLFTSMGPVTPCPHPLGTSVTRDVQPGLPRCEKGCGACTMARLTTRQRDTLQFRAGARHGAAPSNSTLDKRCGLDVLGTLAEFWRARG